MNFDELKNKIESAAKLAFTEMFEKHGSEGIYAFALHSDEGAMTVCPATNTVQYLASVEPADQVAYYKFEPAEWNYEIQGATKEFNEICKSLRAELAAHEDDEEWFEGFQKSLYGLCVDVLEKLKNEGFFRKIVGKDIYLSFTVSEYEIERDEVKKIAARLNGNEYLSEYLDWVKTWR